VIANSLFTDLDLIDCKLLGELQANAHISFADLSRRVSLSTPAVIERVKRLEERGVIVGYHAQVIPSAVGRSVEAFVKVSVAGDKLLKFAQSVKKIEEVLECAEDRFWPGDRCRHLVGMHPSCRSYCPGATPSFGDGSDRLL
jgi:DNA-binding Lrp family transcriptional regulator